MLTRLHPSIRLRCSHVFSSPLTPASGSTAIVACPHRQSRLRLCTSSFKTALGLMPSSTLLSLILLRRILPHPPQVSNLLPSWLLPPKPLTNSLGSRPSPLARPLPILSGNTAINISWKSSLFFFPKAKTTDHPHHPPPSCHCFLGQLEGGLHLPIASVSFVFCLFTEYP